MKIGLTGGIGCGKTTVAELFGSRGVPVVDADQVTRDLVAPGSETLQQIAAHFGPQILNADGSLDRAGLRRLIFEQAAERNWLESLLHPRVYQSMQQFAESSAAPYVLLVVPLLLETGQRNRVDRLLVIDCPKELQRQRVTKRDKLTDHEFERIVATQMDRTSRLAAADDVITNAGDRTGLDSQVEKLHRHYLAMSQGKGE